MEMFRKIGSIFVIACMLVSGGVAFDDREDKKTYVVRYKNGEQTIPVTVVLDYKKQTEYVINMNSRTPSKSVTLYDFKQRTIAYKDLSNQECFLGRLTHENINNESHTLQLLKNPVESKPLVLSMDSLRPALTPTEIKNIAGQKSAVFCRKMSTWLLSPIKIHERRKRSDDHVKEFHSHYGYQPERQTHHRARISRNRSTIGLRTNIKDVPNLLSASEASRSHKLQLSERPTRIERNFLRHHGQSNRNRSHHHISDSVHEDAHNNRGFYGNNMDDEPKNHIEQTSESYRDIPSRGSARTDNSFSRLYVPSEEKNPVTNPNQVENFSNSKDTFDDTTESDLSSIEPTPSSLSRQQLFRHLEMDIDETPRKHNRHHNPLVKSENEHNAHVPHFREREDFDSSESQVENDHQTYESDINLVNSFDSGTQDTNLTEFHFERLREENSNDSKLLPPSHWSLNENIGTDSEIENYLPVLHGQGISSGIQTFEDVQVDYPVLKKDYYAPSYLFPESSEFDHREELKQKVSSKEYLNEINRNRDSDLVADPDSFIIEGLLSTEDPISFLNTNAPRLTTGEAASRSSTESKRFPPNAVYSISKHTLDFDRPQQLPLNKLQYHSSYNKDDKATSTKSSQDDSHEQFSFFSTESTFYNEHFNDAQNHRSDIPREDHNRGYKEPIEKIRQRNLPHIPNVTINEGFPPHQMRIQNVLRLFTPDEIVIDIEKLPTVETPRNVAGFQRKPTLTTPFPTRRMPTSTGRYNKVRTRNKSRIWKNDNSVTSKIPLQRKFPNEITHPGKGSITYHVRQDTRFHHQLNNLPPGVSMHPRHPNAPFAEFAQNNKRPSVISNGPLSLSGHRQRHQHWKHQNSCCEGNALSSCCRNSMRRGNRRHHRKASLMEGGFNPTSDSRQKPSNDSPSREKVPHDPRDRCQREKMCRTLYQSTQQVLVCRNVKIEGC